MNYWNNVQSFSRRRSSGESTSLSRALRNAMDPELLDPQTSYDPFQFSEDDSSILAAVSSRHSSEDSAPVGKVTKKRENAMFFDRKQSRDTLNADFMSPQQIEHQRTLIRRLPPPPPKPKQVRMDDFLFKAKRVDKGARVFGLQTTHEPKRGSKKKRDSIEKLEVENVPVQKAPEVIKIQDNDVDFSIAFESPSPKRPARTMKLTQCWGKVSSNDPNSYLNDSILDATICKTPERADRSLMETLPLYSPKSVKRKPAQTELFPVKRNKPMFDDERFDEKPAPPIRHVAPNPIRPSLVAQAEQRAVFGRHVSEREQMMRRLVDQNAGLQDRDDGGIERRRAELKDGQVIRNKEMRKNLMHGAACKCCRGYYDGLNMGEEEKRDYIDKVSRHRYVHKPLPDTPEHYWDLTLGPNDEQLSAPAGNWPTTPKAGTSTGIRNWN